MSSSKPSKKPTGRPRYFTKAQEKELVTLAKRNPDWTLKQLAQGWVDAFAPSRTPAAATTVSGVLAAHGFVFKQEPAVCASSPLCCTGSPHRYEPRHREASSGYPSDLTDEQWALLEPMVSRPGTRGPAPTNPRALLNAILYVNRTGCPWRYLPHDFPKWNTVAKTFYRWKDSGLWDSIHDTLRAQVRTKEGREETPSLVILDSQSVKTTEKGGLEVGMQERR